jgi:DNA ligase-1
MTFKPMLASAIEDTSKLKFPVLASIKLDGIRATVQGGKLLSRSLKLIPNRQVQQMFKNLPEGLDGELIYGDPAHPDCYRTTTSIVMSEDKDASGIMFHVFDIYNGDANRPFSSRLNGAMTAAHLNLFTVHVPHVMIEDEEDLLKFEAGCLEDGHEGVMVRSLDGPYKQGRSSVKQGHLLKLKRFLDAEAEITGYYEEMENQNEAKTNNLGRTERSSAKSGLVGKGGLGGFEVRGIGRVYAGVAFQIGGGFTARMRDVLWQTRSELVGEIVKYKYFPTGSKERPRFPVFLGFRDKRDIS